MHNAANCPHRLIAAAAVVAMMVVTQADTRAQDSRFQNLTYGLQDTQTGLIWGHHFTEVDAVMSGATILRTWDYAMGTWVTVWIDSDGDGINDGGEEWVTVTYGEFSAEFYGPPDVDGGVWRLPTREELQDAIDAGLMAQLDTSPADGLQLFDPATFNEWVWSSTKGKKKRGGFDSAYTVSLIDGLSNNITVGSVLWGAIPVYDPAGGGPGKGKGGKQK